MNDLKAATGELGDISHRRILHVALPIVISNATVPILGAVDTGVVGQMGEAAPIGAVGIGAVVLAGLYWIFGFLRMGTTGLTAKALGAGRHGEVAAMLTRAVVIGLFAGVLLILTQVGLFKAAFWLSPASPEVEALAAQYLQIRIWSAPAAIALYGVTGWLIAQERTKAVLVVQLWMNGLNILLDLWFVLGLNLGVEGVAFATLIAEVSGCALALWMCREVFESPEWKSVARILDRAALGEMARVNGDILLRSLMLQSIFMSFLLFGADFGDDTLAANQILMQFLYITAHTLDGFAFAVETFSGKAVGARNRSALRRAAKMTGIWAAVGGVLLGVVYGGLGGLIIDAMTTSLNLRDLARDFLPWVILSPVLGIAPFMLDGIFIGATQTRDMRNMMAVSAIIYFLCVLVMVPLWGNHGLWAALMVSFVARGLSLALRYPALEAKTS
ncbi:MATE family efflux transporter [Shimia marina]|uniref:DNA-damage-inducible protein F n=1 Tax=Shimia marina TaxID=321267 RepID=A0A0P1EJK9_9RHOB|nr:MATE family efflux transporter [Shimia marina]CUH50674.1 DNA-damage-inducible protein F [Shimia marina]SFE37146.1 multidrug resistance protein, MATE family [Shimia marina]